MAEAVARVLAFERHGVPISALGVPSPPAARDHVLEALAEHRVVAVVAEHLDALGVDGETAFIVRAMRSQSLAAGLRLQLDTDVVSTLLRTAGIEHLIVKGAALSAMVGRPPPQRGAGDVDVWVRPADVARAEAVVHANGWTRSRATLPFPSDGWRWQVLMAVGNELPQQAETRSSIDLHWRLTQFAGEDIPTFDEAYRRSVPVTAVGDGVRTLCPTDAVRHLAQHARKDVWPGLRYVVDFVRVIDCCDHGDVVDMADRLPNVALALAVAELATGTTVEGWQPDERTRLLAREAWGSCLSLRNSLAHRLEATGMQAARTRVKYEWWQCRSAPTWRARASFAGRLAMPLQAVVRPSAPRG